jgi:hypothetical protein
MDFGSAEEISVDTAAMGAEVGGGGGANINVVPKSGGNTPKGEAIYSLTGKGYWDGFSGSNITPELRAQGVTDPSLQKLYDFNANAGGPFIKDRLWWFGSFRNYHTIEATPSYTIVNSDGSLTNPFLSNLRNYTASGKYQINKNNQLSMFWTYNKKFQPNRNAGPLQPLPQGTLNQQSPKNLFNGDWTSVFGQNTFLEVSASYFHMHWPSDWSDEFKALSPAAQRPSTLNLDTGIFIAGPEPTGQRFRDAYRQQTNIAMTKYIDGFVGASHQLKTGFETWWTPTGSDGFNIFDDVRLRYRGATNCTPTVQSGCTADSVLLYNTPLTQKTKMNNYAAFIQDRATYNRFTVNLGLRWSYYSGDIPAQGNGGAEWGAACAACNASFPEIKPNYSWNTLAPRTGIVWKATEDGKTVLKASYSRYYEVMYTTEFSSINGNSINTGGVATYAWNGAFQQNGLPVLGKQQSQFVPKSNTIDPNLKDPRDDEIMFAFQRELANNWSLNVDWIQRWFHDATVDQDCYGLPCNTVATTAYVQNKVVTDFGPDNLVGTADDRTISVYNVLPQYAGKDTFFHTNCGNNVSVSCVQKYRALELSVSKRMSNRWQMQTSYVFSRLDGDQLGISTTSSTNAANVYDFTNPNNLLSYSQQGRGANDQPHAFKLLGSYQAPFGITVGANYQALSGLPRDRTLTISGLNQGTQTLRMEPRGTYRFDTLNLLSLRADKSFRINGSRRASFIVELHNVLNSNADQNSVGTVTRGFVNQADFLAKQTTTSYFGRVQEIVAPRILKLGFKFEF